MKKPIQKLLLILFAITCYLPVSNAQAQGTAFIYQGQLIFSNGPANGSYDLAFTLYNTNTGGVPVADTVTNLATEVNNGAFAVVLDFGATFDGSPRWLELAAQTNGGAGFVTQTPRDPVFAVPYAIMANSASNLLGVLPAAQISGTIDNTNLPANAIFSGTVTASSYSGGGGGLTDLNPSAIAPGGVSSMLSLTNVNNYFIGAHAGYFSGFYSGNGAGLTNLNPSAIAPGWVGAMLYLTNAYNDFVGYHSGYFNGSYSGNGAALTNLNPSAIVLTNLNPSVIASGGVGSMLFLTNVNNSFAGSFAGAYYGNAAGVTNLNPAAIASGGVGSMLYLTNAYNVFEGSFSGNHFGNAAGMTNLNPSAIASGNVTSAIFLINPNNVLDGSFAGYYYGNAAGLTNLNPSAIAPGTVTSALSLVNTSNTFNGSFNGSFNGFASGYFNGDGSRLTSLNASQLASGTISLALLPGGVITNGASGVALAGTFSGNFWGNATTATTATSAGTANYFSGTLAGDVIGTQGATVVASVGGQPAASVASGASAANAATAANTAGAIVERDAAGNFTAGTITANLAGNATTATTAANFSGSIADSQLSANVALLNGTNSFVAANTFAGVVTATNANNNFSGTLTGILVGNAATATAATTAGTANNFSGTLAGDVNGTQGATVVASVGGQPAASVASGASAANAATAANTAGAIVMRDAAGNFTAGTITANLVGNAATATAATTAATATTALNVTGDIADAQLSANIARLNGTNKFAAANTFVGEVIATNANNVVNGTISGNGGGLTNLPTTLNYVYSFDTNTQSVSVANTFQDILFSTDAQINGWKHKAGSASFTNGPAGLYLVEYAAETATAASASTTVSVRAVLNGTEVPGSQSAASPASSGFAVPVAKSFILFIPTANTNVLKFQFTGSSAGNNRLLSNLGQGTSKPDASMTVIRIQ